MESFDGDRIDTIFVEGEKMITTKNLLKTKTSETDKRFDLFMLCADMGLLRNQESYDSFSVEGGIDIIIRGERLSTTFYHISAFNECRTLLFRNNPAGNGPTPGDDSDATADMDNSSYYPIARIELGIDAHNASNVMINYDGMMYSLEDYVKPNTTIYFDTSVLTSGDVVRVNTKTIHNDIWMIEKITESNLIFWTRNSDKLGGMTHRSINPSMLMISDLFKDLSIEKIV